MLGIWMMSRCEDAVGYVFDIGCFALFSLDVVLFLWSFSAAGHHICFCIHTTFPLCTALVSGAVRFVLYYTLLLYTTYPFTS